MKRLLGLALSAGVGTCALVWLAFAGGALLAGGKGPAQAQPSAALGIPRDDASFSPGPAQADGSAGVRASDVAPDPIGDRFNATGGALLRVVDTGEVFIAVSLDEPFEDGGELVTHRVFWLVPNAPADTALLHGRLEGPLAISYECPARTMTVTAGDEVLFRFTVERYVPDETLLATETGEPLICGDQIAAYDFGAEAVAHLLGSDEQATDRDDGIDFAALDTLIEHMLASAHGGAGASDP